MKREIPPFDLSDFADLRIVVCIDRHAPDGPTVRIQGLPDSAQRAAYSAKHINRTCTVLGTAVLVHCEAAIEKGRLVIRSDKLPKIRREKPGEPKRKAGAA